MNPRPTTTAVRPDEILVPLSICVAHGAKVENIRQIRSLELTAAVPHARRNQQLVVTDCSTRIEMDQPIERLNARRADTEQ